MTGTAITRRQILLVSLLLWAGSFLYLTLAPALPKLGSVDSNDYADWGHVVGTMGLAVILYLLIAESVRWPRWRAAVVTIVTASAFGVAIEILQGVDGARDPAVSDALYDALGAAVAVAVLTLLPRRNRVITALVAVGTAGFTALTVVAAVFLTPVPVGDLDCSVAAVAHHTPSPRPPRARAGERHAGSSRSTSRDRRRVPPFPTSAARAPPTCGWSSRASRPSPTVSTSRAGWRAPTLRRR